MLVIDSEKAARIARQKAVENHKAKICEWLEEQHTATMFMDDPKLDPTNALARIGTPVHSRQLEARLKKLNPNLHFEFNQFNSTKKAMYLVDQRGKRYLFPYEHGVMPERSILREAIDDVTDPSVFQSGFVLNRKDLPKYEYTPGENGGIGKIEFDKSKPMPGANRVRMAWHEIQRGWRTVLLRLVAAGAITPSQAESVFGAANTPEWRAGMGKAPKITPW